MKGAYTPSHAHSPLTHIRCKSQRLGRGGTCQLLTQRFKYHVAEIGARVYISTCNFGLCIKRDTSARIIAQRHVVGAERDGHKMPREGAAGTRAARRAAALFQLISPNADSPVVTFLSRPQIMRTKEWDISKGKAGQTRESRENAKTRKAVTCEWVI